jgi:hypothetical protein
MDDTDCQWPVWGRHAQAKDALEMLLSACVLAPWVRWASCVITTVWVCHGYYDYVHRRSHRDLPWAWERLPWHYDHLNGARPACQRLCDPFWLRLGDG